MCVIVRSAIRVRARSLLIQEKITVRRKIKASTVRDAFGEIDLSVPGCNYFRNMLLKIHNHTRTQTQKKTNKINKFMSNVFL